MVDWLVFWGAAQAAGFIFKPILEDLAKEGAKDFAKDFFKDSLKHVLLREKDPRQVAAGKAIKEFLQLMQQQLKFRCKLSDAEIKQYINEIKKFIHDKSVRQILGQAFKRDCDSLDTNKLKNIWNELKLKPLPANFNWEGVAEQYLIKSQEILWESEDLRKILDSQNLENIEKNTDELAGIIPDFDLQQYREGILEAYGNLNLASLDTTGCAYNELKLWQIFIPQNVREVREFLPQIHELPKEHQRRLRESKQLEAEHDDEDLERYKRVYFEQPIRSVLEIVSERQNFKYLVVLGDPGSGKSTLLKYLALKWAESQEIDKPIPLLIELRTYMRNRDDRQCQNFLEFFHQSSGSICHLNQHKLDEQLNAGKALVMFDGLDEIFDVGKREDVITDIHRFSNKYPNVQIIVTSRVIGYKPQRLRDAEFRHFMLQDLETEQITDFINRWHDLTFNDEADKVRKRERLQAAIANSSAIKELAGNPLLLTMMAILNRNQELPRDRAELYNQASRVLLHQWDVERALLEDGRVDPKTIEYKDKQAMLRQVAHHLQTSEKSLAGNAISAGDLEKILTDYLKTREVDKAREVAKVMVNQLRTRNFMLCFLGADYYGFVHRTFLEYFCAWEFVWQFKETQTLTIEQLKTEVFGKHWHDETWHEVLRLIAGMIEAKFVSEIIAYLIEQNGEPEKFSNLFLAAGCLSEVRNRNLIGSIATQLLQLLKSLIDDDNENVQEAAIQELAKGWKDDPDTLPWLKQTAQYDDNKNVQLAAIQELAKGWKDDPDTLPWLKQTAQYHKFWAVQEAAIQELVKGWKDDPNTLPWLKQTAQNDDDLYLLQLAIGELAKGWKDDPNTLPILKQSAQNDDNENVRRAAIQELVRGWKDDPDTLPILKQSAQNDDNEDVRETAIQELARDWKDDPGMFEFLCDRAVKDPFVRQVDWEDNLRQKALEVIIDRYGNVRQQQILSLLRDRQANDPDKKVREFAKAKLEELNKPN